MSKTIIQGKYGYKDDPCEIFVAEKGNGLSWYAVKGKRTVNLAFSSNIFEGMSTMDLLEIGYFANDKIINSLEDLWNAVYKFEKDKKEL